MAEAALGPLAALLERGKAVSSVRTATDSEMRPSRLTLYGLAMVGGLGMTMMVIGASIAVIFGAGLDAASTHTLGLVFVVGLLLEVLAITFWLGWTRPFERFDDINVPAKAEPH